MIRLWYFTFVTSAFFVQQYGCDNVEPQIKVVGTQIDYLNPYYCGSLVYTVNHVNETFNNLSIYWNVIRDLPARTSVYTKVYVTDSTYQGGTLVLNNITPVCRENENRHLLPNILVVSDNLLNTQCLKKGIYVTDSLQQYRFEVMLPGLQNKGSYYRAEYIFGTPLVNVGKVTFYNQWGYLNKN